MQQFLDEIEESVPAPRRYARALTRNADRADDLVQDCLERAIRKQGLWKPTGPLKGWLFRILLNLYRNGLRQTRRRGDHVSIDALVIEPAIPAPQPGRMGSPADDADQPFGEMQRKRAHGMPVHGLTERRDERFR